MVILAPSVPVAYIGRVSIDSSLSNEISQSRNKLKLSHVSLDQSLSFLPFHISSSFSCSDNGIVMLFDLSPGKLAFVLSKQMVFHTQWGIWRSGNIDLFKVVID